MTASLHQSFAKIGLMSGSYAEAGERTTWVRKDWISPQSH
jgi:hypothetical protein